MEGEHTGTESLDGGQGREPLQAMSIQGGTHGSFQWEVLA